MNPTAALAEERLQALAEPERVPVLRRFFRTGPGQYAEGDRFLGLRTATLRKLVRELREMPLEEMLVLLRSPWHEARLGALLLMVDLYARSDAPTRERVFRAYLANAARVNNWDLVDASAEHIVGAHLLERDRALLGRLARSPLLWERRIAVLASFHFIKKGDPSTTLELAELLLEDREDLIHKAVGWMLREVGKRDRAALERFLARHAREMPRTMLRYAIERFEPEARRRWLAGELGDGA